MAVWLHTNYCKSCILTTTANDFRSALQRNTPKWLNCWWDALQNHPQKQPREYGFTVRLNVDHIQANRGCCWSLLGLGVHRDWALLAMLINGKGYWSNLAGNQRILRLDMFVSSVHRCKALSLSGPGKLAGGPQSYSAMADGCNCFRSKAEQQNTVNQSRADSNHVLLMRYIYTQKS